MSFNSRRMKAEGATGIGAWLEILNFISTVSIPVNIGLIYFTGHVGENNEVGDSTFVSTLEMRNRELWTPLNVFFLCIVLEHILIFIKTGLSAAIADVPKKSR